jgi:phosphatidate cytidylyltransferase
MLKQRVLTAIPLAAIVLITILYLDRFYVMLLLALMLCVSTFELTRLIGVEKPPLRWLAALLMTALFYLALPHMDQQASAYHAYLGLALWCLVLLLMFGYRYSGQWSFSQRLLIGLFSALLLWICVHGLMFIHGHFERGGWLLLYLLTLVWVADIGAYFSGKRFGRHKLSPTISPGKTWEGVAGGLLLNLLWASLIFKLSDGWGLTYGAFIALSLLTSALSVVGDLYESILKREAGLKDSGSILPGHGGMLDRIDSVIAATPVFLGGLILLGAV